MDQAGGAERGAGTRASQLATGEPAELPVERREERLGAVTVTVVGRGDQIGEGELQRLHRRTSGSRGLTVLGTAGRRNVGEGGFPSLRRLTEGFPNPTATRSKDIKDCKDAKDTKDIKEELRSTL